MCLQFGAGEGVYSEFLELLKKRRMLHDAVGVVTLCTPVRPAEAVYSTDLYYIEPSR